MIRSNLVEPLLTTSANQLWYIDCCCLDTLVLHPSLPDKFVRPWLVTVMDDYSRGVAGFHLNVNDWSLSSIIQALRHAMLPKSEPQFVIHGIPEAIQTDHGLGFRSSQFEQFCEHFNIKISCTIPYHPMRLAKMERLFYSLLHYLSQVAVSKQPLTLPAVEAYVRDFVATYHEQPHPKTNEPPCIRWLSTAQTIRRIHNTAELDKFSQE